MACYYFYHIVGEYRLHLKLIDANLNQYRHLRRVRRMFDNCMCSPINGTFGCLIACIKKHLNGWFSLNIIARVYTK